MVKKYKNKKGYSVKKLVYYIIQEHQTAYDRWISIGDDTYGLEKGHKDFTACGECWQETRVHGTFDKKYAIDLCNRLNKALKDGSIYDCFNHRAFKDEQIESFKKAAITEFRVVDIVRTIKQKVVTEE